MSENTRELVLDMLMEVTRQERPSHVVHSQMLMKYQYLEKQERRFMSRLFKGTLERMVTLDYVIGRFSSVKVSKIKPVLKNILRMSVYQILYMESIPHSAACNEAVKLAVRRDLKIFGASSTVCCAISAEMWIRFHGRTGKWSRSFTCLLSFQCPSGLAVTLLKLLDLTRLRRY